MIREYIDKAMEGAHYELLSDDEGFYGEISLCPGVYANASTLEQCRKELEEVLEEWILLGVSRTLPLPRIGGIDLLIRKEDVA